MDTNLNTQESGTAGHFNKSNRNLDGADSNSNMDSDTSSSDLDDQNHDGQLETNDEDIVDLNMLEAYAQTEDKQHGRLYTKLAF